jgi:phenylpropionate dioxygenase-like ring-hydroxylating dioxygenase large terminal subunit
MLTAEDNRLLTQVGPGTLMGNLLRRYWHPALLSWELPEPDCPPVRVRLLGEDLIAFRDTSDHIGLVANACPHRGASMFFGRNEENGLRCVYHGWKFDVTGACVDMPSEPAESNFKTKVRIGAYPTHESGGVVWTYMGPPEKQPGFRDLGTEGTTPEDWFATKVHSPCNWLQGLEGNVDTAHISYLHRDLRQHFHVDDTDTPGNPSTPMSYRIWALDGAPELEVQDTWYGLRYAGIRNTPNGYKNVRVSDFFLPYGTYVPYTPVGGDMCILMVPIDDTSLWRYHIATPRSRYAEARRGPSGRASAAALATTGPILPRDYNAANDYQIDRKRQRTELFSGVDHFVSQDFMVTESMGPIYDRTAEHLGTTDKAVIRMRRLLLDSARKQQEGMDPAALDASLPWQSIRSAERILERGEDWRFLGTPDDPATKETEAASP